ncbi:MAG: hypothetical protein RB191_19875 [Terriglobia bacterium]|nr:hypothetical protein [Terriglobia bacterium]
MTREQLNALYQFVISTVDYERIRYENEADPGLKGTRQFAQVKAIAEVERVFGFAPSDGDEHV